ncbi:MAG: tRNA (guanosine(46)-N7)-methyltransferase TrmB [Bacteroidetes bacterium]|nr:MAG: tRNA (guanosine(46)-N7)-methyltransferase TrmB [Bacteroidota bacterium]
MPKNKHRKFTEINAFANVVQPGYRYPVSDYPLKGQWGQKFFYNNQPIILEVGCGKGEYTVGLAKAFPGYNFIGIDIKGNRLWTGAKYALEKGMSNVGFLRIQAEHLEYFFDTNEISGIWVTFPDPQLNKPRVKKRLTSPAFLSRYHTILKPEGSVYLKTDNALFYEYTLEVIKQYKHDLVVATHDLYGESNHIDTAILDIQTYYENIFLQKGEKICFTQFRLQNGN